MNKVTDAIMADLSSLSKTTQTETIVWRHFPEEKPPSGDTVYVQYQFAETYCLFDPDMLGSDGDWLKHTGKVVAWTNYFRGWKQ